MKKNKKELTKEEKEIKLNEIEKRINASLFIINDILSSKVLYGITSEIAGDLSWIKNEYNKIIEEKIPEKVKIKAHRSNIETVLYVMENMTKNETFYTGNYVMREFLKILRTLARNSLVEIEEL